MKSIIVRASVLSLGVALLFLAGCAAITTTKSPRFYVLSPLAGLETGKQMVFTQTSNNSISIGLISLPKYLKRSQIVTRAGNNELQLAEFDRWAGKIEEDIGRVIAENLAYLLSTDRVLSYPAIGAVETDFTIEMDISRLDGSLGGNVELSARWAVFDVDGNIAKGVTLTHMVEPVQGTTYADMIAAQSRVLASLSRELADAIKQLSDR